MNRTLRILTIILCLAILASACGPASEIRSLPDEPVEKGSLAADERPIAETADVLSKLAPDAAPQNATIFIGFQRETRIKRFEAITWVRFLRPVEHWSYGQLVDRRYRPGYLLTNNPAYDGTAPNGSFAPVRDGNRWILILGMPCNVPPEGCSLFDPLGNVDISTAGIDGTTAVLESLLETGVADNQGKLFDLVREHFFNATYEERRGESITARNVEVSGPDWVGVSVSPAPESARVGPEGRSRATHAVDLRITDDEKFFTREGALAALPTGYSAALQEHIAPIIGELDVRSSDLDRSEPVRFSAFDISAARAQAEKERLDQLPQGYIRLTANHRGVDILIDGVKAGSITEKPFVAKLPAGRHLIMARKHLFGSKSIQVEIEADDAFAYDFQLLPAGNLDEDMGRDRIIQSTAQLAVVTTRNDLTVYIEGQARVPPFRLSEIASGVYDLDVRGPNVRKSVRIEVEPNTLNTVDLDDYVP